MFESTVSTKHRWKDLLFRFIESRQTLIRPFAASKNKINKQTTPATKTNLKNYLFAKWHNSSMISECTIRFRFRFYYPVFPVVFFFVGHLPGFISVGKVLEKTVRILALNGIKWKWVASGTRFSLEFSGQLCVSFFLSFSPACMTESWSFGHNMRDVKSCLWTLEQITSQAVQGVVGLHGRFRGEWISRLTTSFHDLCPYSRKKWRRNVENSSGATSRRRVVSPQSVENFDVISTVYKTRLIVGSLDTKDHR